MQRTITNSATGDTIHFWSSPMLGDGAELVFRTTLPAFAKGAPVHIHEGPCALCGHRFTVAV